MAIIAMLADVDRTNCDRTALQLHQLGRETNREMISLGWNPDEDEVLRAPVPLHDLVRDARQRPADLLGVHHRRFEAALGDAHAVMPKAGPAAPCGRAGRFEPAGSTRRARRR